MMKQLSLLLSVILSIGAMGQSEADWWYFGTYAGMNFPNSVNPVNNLSGQISTQEGCSAISDDQGNLLMYSDGSTVYDRNHNTMPNGTGLMGNASSTQSGIIVPWPNDPDRYIIFTVPAQANTNGLRYSVVDMTLNSGNGAVVTGQKNILLSTPVTEKVTATLKTGGGGYWVVAHGWNNANFLAYEVTSTGVNTTPVTSTVGTVHNGTTANTIGYMKISPDGSRLALAIDHGLDLVEIFDFNASTGVVSNPITLTGPWTGVGPYGVEFSPNSQVLYVAEEGTKIYQYDLTLGTAAAMSANRYTVNTLNSGFNGALQLGPDQKLYCAHYLQQHLNVINDPNVLGSGCNFTYGGFSLSPRTCRLGLPAFVQSWFNTDFGYQYTCFGDSTYFYMDSLGIDSAFWDFGDPNSGVQNNHAEGFHAWHQFTDTGTFDVVLVAYQDSVVDTQTHEVYIFPQPYLELGEDTALCVGHSVTFNVEQPHASYLWHNGSTDSAIVVTQDSVVSVTVYGVCDTLVDTIHVNFYYPFDLDLGPDTSICHYDSLLLDPGLPNALNFTWSNYTNDSVLLTVDSGTYHVSVFDSAYCEYKDTIQISYLPQLVVELGPDMKFCYKNSVPLNPVTQYATNFNWSSGQTSPTINVTTTDTYHLEVSDGFCYAEDSVIYTLIHYPTADLGPDTSFCLNEAVPLSADLQDPDVSYLWNTGETSADIDAGIQGLYWVQVSDSNCSIRDTVLISQHPVLTVTLGEERHLCEGEVTTIQPQSNDNLVAYQWNNGSTDSEVTLSDDAYLAVTVTNGQCSASHDVRVNFYEVPTVDLGPDTSVCRGDTLYFNAKSKLPLATYTWQDGSKVPVQPFDFKKTRLVWVEVLNEVCKASDSVAVAIRPNPKFDLGRDTSICPNRSTLLEPTGDPLVHFKWSTGDSTRSIRATAGATYKLKASDGYCFSVDSIEVKERRVPEVKLEAPEYYCLGDNVVLDAYDPDIIYYRWQDGSVRPTNRVDSAGTYYLVAEHYCGVSTDTVTIEWCECQVWAPTAFHPDDDGLNDAYRLEVDCKLTKYKLSIYDRWGHRVFYTEDPEVSWDGKINGRLGQAGTYAWKLEYKGHENGSPVQEEKDGVFLLLR